MILISVLFCAKTNTLGTLLTNDVKLLLDVYSLKKAFIEIPTVRADLRGNASFHKFVNTSIGRVEAILKVLMTRSQPPEGLVQNYFYTIGDRSESNFAKILEIKGVRKHDQIELMDQFKEKRNEHTGLIDNSSLISSIALQQPSSPAPLLNTRFDPSSLTAIISAARDGVERSARGLNATIEGSYSANRNGAAEISEKIPFSNIRRFFLRQANRDSSSPRSVSDSYQSF